MKVVIDTNGLLRSIPRDGSYRRLYDAFAASQFTWVVSTEILLEYTEMTGYYYSPVGAELNWSPHFYWRLPIIYGKSLTFGLDRLVPIRMTTNLWTVR